MSKRNIVHLDDDYKERDIKKAFGDGEAAQGSRKWLAKKHADEQQMLLFAPVVLAHTMDWEQDVYCILAEDYCCFDAKLDTSSLLKQNGKAHARALNFKGTCPFHRYAHGQNKWALINTVGYNTTLFLCHHDNTKRLICHRIPFPVEDA